MDDQFPPRLRDDLESLYRGSGEIPSQVDDAILNRSRAALAGRNRWRPLRLVGAAAAAACLLLVARVTLRSPSIPDDLDGNRRVDIVDALILARQIEAGKGQDVNHDGKVDTLDVTSIAMVAVRLDGGVQ